MLTMGTNAQRVAEIAHVRTAMAIRGQELGFFGDDALTCLTKRQRERVSAHPEAIHRLLGEQIGQVVRRRAEADTREGTWVVDTLITTIGERRYVPLYPIPEADED